MSVDIEIDGSGFYSIIGMTEQGEEWINENVQGALDGVAYSDQTSMAYDIADGALADDLTVTVNGNEYLGG